MTSLMWNGVEGVNMYMMLVKVLNAHVHRFVLKSAVFAWGKLRMVHSYVKYTTQLFESILFNEAVNNRNIQPFLYFVSFLLNTKSNGY